MSDRNAIVMSKFEKRRYGLKHGEPKRPYAVGDMVRVRKPPSTYLKGQNPYSRPLQVIECHGRWNYKLSDGQTWNARRLIRHRPQAPTWDEEDEEVISAARIAPDQPPAPPLPPPAVRRSERTNFGIPRPRLIEET